MIQNGVSQCIWSKTDLNCSLRPPPVDPVFTILVALLTTIVTIPIIILLHYILNSYASNWPGSRGFVDDMNFTDQKEQNGQQGQKGQKNQSNDNDIENITTAEKIKIVTYSSPLGEEIKKKLPPGNTVDYTTANAISQMAYAGTYVHFDINVTTYAATIFYFFIFLFLFLFFVLLL